MILKRKKSVTKKKKYFSVRHSWSYEQWTKTKDPMSPGIILGRSSDLLQGA